MPVPKNRRRVDYFEAIIQLRPAKQKLLSFVLAEIARNKDCTIAKVDELKTGVDLYVSSQRFARALGKRLNKRFDGKLTISRKIFTKDYYTSKEVFRVTVLFRLKEQ